MTARNVLSLTVAATGIAAMLLTTTIAGQAPAGQGRGGGGAGGGGGRGGAQLPSSPVAATMPTFKEVTGPGAMFPGLLRLPDKEDLAHFKYVVKEYFVSGIAQGQPYTTRILVRRPADVKKFSGIVVAEPMHPSGNSWMFHFVHTYAMAQGHISLEIVTGSTAQFTTANTERYKDLQIGNNQANEIIAQAGFLAKSGRRDGPLEGLPLRKMILMGTSASAGIVTGYLPAHMVYRDHDLKPIFDGFLPTSQGGNNQTMKVDVPVILMPTMTEVVSAAAGGNRYRRPDGDAPGDQFRIYEVAGMSHNDSRVNPTYEPDPCKYPVSRFPQGMGMTVGLDHLIQWVDKGKVPPRADYIAVDNDTNNDGSVLALDANGNAKGGVRNPYVDVPVYRYVSPNEGASPPIANAAAIVANRGGGNGAQFFCGIGGYQLPLTKEQTQALYKNKKDYQSKVEQRTNQLIKEGWLSPVYKDLILADAAKVVLP
jgi:hypothetical protein